MFIAYTLILNLMLAAHLKNISIGVCLPLSYFILFY